MTEIVNRIAIDDSVALEDRTAIVPAIWPGEIANALLVGERRKRIRQPEVRRFVELLKGLTILEDGKPFADTVSNVLPLGREYDLSAYDATYLDVAVRHEAPLATLDAALQKAGRAADIKIFEV